MLRLPHGLGRIGEDRAAEYLRGQGFRVLARNWRHKALELDLICEDGETLVFVEVKTRSSDRFGGPESAVTLEKQKRLARAARAWLAENHAWQRPCRFDVIAIVRHGDTLNVEHYRHAFAPPQTVGHSHADWQPW